MPARHVRHSIVSKATLALAVLAAGLLAPSASATFPDHNGLIVFGADTGAGSQLYTVRPNGHGLRQLTYVEGDAVHPDWSPDGRTIVFALETEESASIQLMNADGSGLRNLTPTPACCQGQPSFTPDGKRIVFGRFIPETNDSSIWSMNVDGSDQVRLTSGVPGGTDDPNISPDGQTLSYVGFNGLDFGQGLFTSGLDGSNTQQLVPYTADVAIKHDWAPDGRHLVFTDNADFPHPGDSANIATIRPDGTDLTYLTHYQGGDLNAFAGGYSPDGRWIIFRLEDHGQFGLYRMRPDGSGLHAILKLSSLKPRFIDWGPSTKPSHGDLNEG